MATMQAYQIDSTGEALDQLKLRTVPKPTIQTETEVLIKVKAAAVNPSDLLFIAGTYHIKPILPNGPVGFEGSGDIEEVGKAVTDFHPGQLVHFVAPIGGSWAEYIVLDTKISPPVPVKSSYEAAAQITINPVTVVAMIIAAGVQKGDYLVQTAASSALGRILIQIAKRKEIKTINIVRRDEHKDPLLAIGADVVINSEKVDDLAAAIKDALPEEVRKEGGVKFAFDAVGGKTGSDIIKALRPAGTFYLYGLLSGKPIVLDLNNLLFQYPIVTGFWMIPWLKQNPEKGKAAYKEIVAAIENKELDLPFLAFDGKAKIVEAIKHSIEPGKTEKTIIHF